jgi:hypothetical protein
MRRVLATIAVSTVLSLSFGTVEQAMASPGSYATKQKCDQSALAAYNAYQDASRAIVAAFKTVTASAKATYLAAQQSGVATVRKTATAKYQAALADARSIRTKALSALGTAPHPPTGCKERELHS